jgi:DNA-binding Xre family transcriptional regulator
MTDTYELEKVIRQSGLTKKQCASELGLSEQGFLLKLNNKNEFKASEIDKLCQILHLPDNSLFFVKDVN